VIDTKKAFRRSPLASCTKFLGLAVLVAAVAGGCAYRGRIDNPVERKLSWFSYLDGSDIRTSCGEGSLDRYRLVYNASYEEQVRSYEVTADGAGGAYLVARVSRTMDLTEFSLSDPLGPWRWAEAPARLSPEDFAALRSRLAESGFADGAPVGLSLPSPSFYWVASGCQGGVFHFNAWAHPQTDFAQLTFIETLLAHDGTGVGVNPPRVVPTARLQEQGRQDDFTQQRFTLTVREHGFGRLLPPL
jgi:hypothetical protein